MVESSNRLFVFVRRIDWGAVLEALATGGIAFIARDFSLFKRRVPRG